MLHRWLLLILALVMISPVQAQDVSDAIRFRFVHLAPSLTQATLSLNDSFTTRLEYNQITDWESANAGILTVSLDGVTLESFDAQADEWLTLILTTDTQARPALTVLREDTSTPATQEARLTLYYAVAGGLPQIDVLLDEMLLTRGLSNGQSLTVSVVANRYNVQLTNPDAPTERLITIDDLTLSKESVYLLVIYGEADAPQSQLIISDPPAPQTTITTQPTETPTPQPQGTAALRLAHLSSGTPPIDIYLNGEKGNTRVLRFPDFTGWQTLPAGLYRVGVTLADAPLSEALIAPIDIAFQAGTFTNVMLIGALANNTLTLHLLEENYEELRQGVTRLSVFNAHPGVGPINVTLDNGVELVTQLGYPGYFGSNDGIANLILDAGLYDLTFSADNTANVLFELPNRNLLAGRSYFITVISADPPFFLTFSDLRETEALIAESE